MAGLGVAAVGYAGRYLLRQLPNATKTINEAMKNLPKFDAESMANSKYYKGGFDPKMNRREAALILGRYNMYYKQQTKYIYRIYIFSPLIFNYWKSKTYVT